MTSNIGLRPLGERHVGLDGQRTPLLSETGMDELRGRFRTERRASDVREVDRRWYLKVGGAWRKRLEGDSEGLDDEAVAMLCIGVNETLSMRDALILSIMSDISQESLIELVANPHAPRSAALVCKTLTDGFENSDNRPDAQRCQNGIDELARMVCVVPEAYSLQPLAALAYVLWWVGQDEQALACALRALTLDDDCTMAAIVVCAVNRGVHPAWLECGDRE